MRSVGIDIGASSIKVVEILSNNKGVHVSRFIEHPLNTTPAFDNEIEILEFLRNLLSVYDQATTRFVFALRQDQVSVRNKLFPFNDRQKILKSLPFELEEDLPFSNETAIFDAKIVRNVGNTAEVLACATPKSRVAAALQKISDCGLDITILSPEGIAFANCFESWNAPIRNLPNPAIAMEDSVPERKISIVVQIGHSRTLVCAFENNLLIGVRSSLWGVKSIAESIMRRYEIPYVEALKEMQTKAFILPSKEGASYDQIVFSDTIASQVKDLARELQISILEFKSEFNGIVESVGLTGGGSQILNLNAYLTMQLEVPVNKISTLSQFSSVAFEKTARTDAVIGVALGLAVEGQKKPRNPAVNLMKGEFARQNTSLKVFWEKWGSTLQIAAASFLVFFFYSMIRESVTLSLADRSVEALKTQAKSVAQLPSRSRNESGVKKYIRDQKKLAAEMRMVTSVSKMNSALDVLKKVSDAIPAKPVVNIDVRKFVVDEDQVQFEGVVGDKRQFSALESSLSNIAIGKVNRLPAQFPTSKPGVRFAFGFKVDRGIQTEMK